jgi:hypothetical protein
VECFSAHSLKRLRWTQDVEIEQRKIADFPV